MAMDTQTILYETLSPLGGTATTADTPPQAPPSSELEPYTVLRNQISLSTIQYPSPETVAPDYFSLEVNEGGGKDAKIAEDSGQLPKTSETSTPAAERSLEGNWFRTNSRFKSAMLRLHKEILDFCDFLSPTPEEKESRTAAIESVFDVIKYIWPNAEVEVFGSFKTGLYLPSSDIDVVILGSNVKSPQMGLYALSKALSQKGIAKKIQVIAKARVPIIKFVEKKSGVAFDLSFDVNNGPKAAEFIMDAVTKWPPLRPLCLILKVFLQQRELNEVYSGGIGSYALLSMLIAMLRTQKDRQASPEHNLGVLLVDFFDMYGCKLNTVDVGVSCNDEGTFFQKSSRGFSVEGRSSLISIEDPQAPDNDVGKNSFNYYQAKSAFAMAYSTLTNTKTIMSLGPKRSILGAIIRPDAVLLERKGGSTGKLKLKNLFPDAEEPVAQLLEDQREIYCNWPLNDEDEEPLPRGNGNLKSSEKKRKASKEKKSAKKAKGSSENGSVKDLSGKEKKSAKKAKGSSENGSVKDRSGKKQRWRHQRSGGDHIYVAGSPVSNHH